MENYNITEAFKALDEVAEIELKDLEPKKSIFSFNDDEDVEELKTLLDIGDVEEEDPVEMIIDIDAESEEDLKDTYVGDVILQCNVCKSLLYKPEDQLVKDETIEDQEVYNTEEECPHCHKLLGYTLIGKVAPYDAEESEELQAEDEAGEDFEDEEVFKSTETEPAEDVDFEEEEKVEVKESLNEDSDKAKELVDVVKDQLEVIDRKASGAQSNVEKIKDELDESCDDCKESEKEELKEEDKPAATSIDDAQKWVDYDMKRYGNISEKTNDLVKKAGFQIIKDDHGDYEVAAGKYDESCDEEDGKKLNEGKLEDLSSYIIDEVVKRNPDFEYGGSDSYGEDSNWEYHTIRNKKDHDIYTGFTIDLDNDSIYSADGDSWGNDEVSLEPANKNNAKKMINILDKILKSPLPKKFEDPKEVELENKENEIWDFIRVLEDKYNVNIAVDHYYGSTKWNLKAYPLDGDRSSKWDSVLIKKCTFDINDPIEKIKGKMEKMAKGASYEYFPMNDPMAKDFLEVESLDESNKEACEEAMFDNVKFDKEVFGKYFDENGHLIPELEKEYWKAVEDHRKETKITKDESLEEAKITNPSGQVIKQWADSKGYKVKVNQEEPKIKHDGKEEYIVDASYTIKIDGNYGFDVFFDNDGTLGTELNTSNKVAYDHIEYIDLSGKEPTEDEIIKALEQGKKSYDRVKGNNKIISKLLNKKLNSESLQNHLPKELVDFFIDEDGLYQLDNYLVIFSKEGIEHNELIDTLKGLLPDELKNNIKPVDFDKDGNYLDQGLTSLSNLADKYYKKDNEKDHIKGAIVKINDSLGEDCKEESCNNEECEKEELEECDVKVENIDEELFDKLVNNYIKEVYDNVESYNTTGGSVDHKDSKVVLEGKIKFKSGKEQDTKFIFEEAKLTKKGKLKLKGINETFAKMKKAFTLQGSLKDNALLAESFTYNYKVNSANGVRRIYGTERIPMNEDLKLITDFSEYKPWSGAELTYRKISDAGMLDTFEQIMEESYPEGLTVTELNDILWFDGDNILEMLGLKDDEVEESVKESFEEYKVIDKDGNEVKEGDEIIDFRGDKAIFKEITKVPGGPSSGKIYVQNAEKGWEQEYYPSVFNLKIVKIEDESCEKTEELEANSDKEMDHKVSKVFNDLQDLAIEAKENGEEYTANKLLDASDSLDDQHITESVDLPEEAVKEIHETIDYFFTQDFKDIISEEDWEDFMITLLNEPAISEEGIANSFEECSPELRSLLDGDKESLVYDEAKRYLSSKMNELKEGCKEESCEEELKDDHHMRSELADAAGDLLDLSIEARDKGEEKTAKKILDAVDDLDQENLMESEVKEDLDVNGQAKLDQIVSDHLEDAVYEAEVDNELDVNKSDMEKAEDSFNDDFFFGESLQENINSVVINPDQDDEIKLEADDIKEVEVKEEDGKKIIEVEQEEKLEDLDTEPYLSDVEDEIEAEFGKGDIAPVEAPVEMIAPVEDEEAVSDEEASAEIEAEFNKEQ